MSDTETLKPKPLFWIIAVLALIWNGMGVSAFILHVRATPEQLVELYGPERAAIAAAQPVWYNAVFALAVFGGVLGCLFLLLRRKEAIWPFAVSFGCTVIQLAYLILSGAMVGVLGVEWIMPIMIPIVAFLLVWHTLNHTPKSTGGTIIQGVLR